MKIVPYFEAKEIVCRCCGRFKFTEQSEKSLWMLSELRKRWRKPIKLNCGYRCEKHNKKVGGAKRSYHLKAQAWDIRITKNNMNRLIDLAMAIGFKGIGRYKNFIHIDNRKRKTFWKK